MQLPQHIIDLVGSLFDEGESDEQICLAVLEAWKEDKGGAYANSSDSNPQKQ